MLGLKLIHVSKGGAQVVAIESHRVNRWYCNDVTWAFGHIISPITRLVIEQRHHQSSAWLNICAENATVTGGFLTQRTGNAKSVSMPWRHHGKRHQDINNNNQAISCYILPCAPDMTLLSTCITLHTSNNLWSVKLGTTAKNRGRLAYISTHFELR